MGTPEEFLRKLPDAPRDDQAQLLKNACLEGLSNFWCET